MSEWEGGEPCPHCGCRDIWEIHVQEQLSKHTEGHSEHLAYGDRLATVRYECDDCQAVLGKMDIDDLEEVIEQ